MLIIRGAHEQIDFYAFVQPSQRWCEGDFSLRLPALTVHLCRRRPRQQRFSLFFLIRASVSILNILAWHAFGGSGMTDFKQATLPLSGRQGVTVLEANLTAACRLEGLVRWCRVSTGNVYRPCQVALGGWRLQGPLVVCPSSSRKPPQALVWCAGLAPFRWPGRSRTPLLQPI